MQVVENFADIGGRVLELHPDSRLAGYYVAKVEIAQVEPVAGYPNLFSWAVGKTLDVILPELQALRTTWSIGSGVRCRIRRKGPDRVYYHSEVPASITSTKP